jgi:glutamine amidotransferase
MKNIGIINLKINNIHSIYEACTAAGFKVNLIDDKQTKYNYDIVILPGIGSYKLAMRKIIEINFKDKILNFLEKKNNLLVGICLGMQLFFTKSNEFGNTKGLNLIKGKVDRINRNLIVPHTGWNKITNLKKNILLEKKFNKKMFYFTHSYFCTPENENMVVGRTNYFNLNFCSVVKQDNIFGMQFHPEKSGETGIKLLKNFKRY